MAGWDTTGKTDTVPSETLFGRRSTCSLAHSHDSKGEPLTPTEMRARFGGACHHSGCLKCGPLGASRLLMPFAGSLEHIQSPVTHLVLHWPVVSMDPSGLMPLRQFLDAAHLLGALMDQGIFGDFDVWCLVSEVAPLNPAQARPHLHLAFSGAHRGLLFRIRAITEAWNTLGGEWLGGKACTLGANLAGTLRYLAKGPLGKHYDSPGGRACANFLLDRFEKLTRNRAAVYCRGGTLVNPLVRRASQARARTLRGDECEVTQDALGVTRDRELAASLPSSLASVEVHHVVRCRRCGRTGRFLTRHGHDAQGQQRWRCKHCRRTFRDRPISQRQAEHAERVRLASQMRGLVDRDGLSMNAAAKALRVGRSRAKDLYDWHRTRYAKKTPHQ